MIKLPESQIRTVLRPFYGGQIGLGTLRLVRTPSRKLCQEREYRGVQVIKQTTKADWGREAASFKWQRSGGTDVSWQNLTDNQAEANIAGSRLQTKSGSEKCFREASTLIAYLRFVLRISSRGEVRSLVQCERALAPGF
ncbi:hypothetical protein BaRGS_00034213 [Batillaria attramentaria]|uniref:Uncharacterized protein n=1 Tax=Batillaria attramentaria TaxID=370345 RepID=A0ABD0JIJ0_9CAEN